MLFHFKPLFPSLVVECIVLPIFGRAAKGEVKHFVIHIFKSDLMVHIIFQLPNIDGLAPHAGGHFFGIAHRRSEAVAGVVGDG